MDSKADSPHTRVRQVSAFFGSVLIAILALCTACVSLWHVHGKVEAALRSVEALRNPVHDTEPAPFGFPKGKIIHKSVDIQCPRSLSEFYEVREGHQGSQGLDGGVWRSHNIHVSDVLIYRLGRQLTSIGYLLRSDGEPCYSSWSSPVVSNYRPNVKEFNGVWVWHEFVSNFASVHKYPRALGVSHRQYLQVNYAYREEQNQSLEAANNYQPPCVFDDFPLYGYFLISTVFLGLAFLGIFLLLNLAFFNKPLYRFGFGGLLVLFVYCGFLSVGGAIGLNDPFFWLPLHRSYDPYSDGECGHGQVSHGGISVPRKYLLTSLNYWDTLIVIGRTDMAPFLDSKKQVAIVSALAEGSGIRQIERMTGVHRDTIMRLGVRVGKGCQTLLDQKMRDLSCQHLQLDEIWGFIGKKERHVRPDDDPTLGDVWTFCAIDSDTKLVPAFKVGKRDAATANAFVADIASRMRTRVQISSDALRAYVEAVENAFGSEVDFAQVIKTYTHDYSIVPEVRFSAPEVVTTEKRHVTGFPNMRLASTSHVERLNGTTRLHMRRLTRLTYAFSKKRENFEAATALHFAYYNFVKRHNTLRCTPAMAAGIERDFWSVGDLVKAAA